MNNKKENRSMYLYTALIFVVALLLILLAFFGQTNVSKLGNRANEIAATQIPQQTQNPADAEFARISNMAAALDTENKDLKAQLETHKTLSAAFSHAITGDIAQADEVILNIDPLSLDDNQKVLYDEIIKMINKGEEQ